MNIGLFGVQKLLLLEFFFYHRQGTNVKIYSALFFGVIARHAA